MHLCETFLTNSLCLLTGYYSRFKEFGWPGFMTGGPQHLNFSYTSIHNLKSIINYFDHRCYTYKEFITNKIFSSCHCFLVTRLCRGCTKKKQNSLRQQSLTDQVVRVRALSQGPNTCLTLLNV